MRKKLLITGASGFLGWNLCNIAQKKWDVAGTVFSHPIEIGNINIFKANLINYRDLKDLFSEVRPDGVIHTAAATDPNYCQMNRAETEKINLDVAVNIAVLCAELRIPYVFTSTDLVFSGEDAPYNEDDPVSPINTYGEQKVRAEEEIQNIYPLSAVCRMPLMFGHPGPVASSFMQPMLKAFREGRELKLFVDEFRTPVSGEVAARGLLLALKKVQGLIHLGGIERISRINFGLLMMDVFGIGEARIVRTTQKEIPMAAKRAPDVSLDSSKAVSLGYRPLPLIKELEKYIDQDIY